MSNSNMAVGDINSNARGSGARDNAGKPNWSLMLFEDLAYIWDIVQTMDQSPVPKGADLMYGMSGVQVFQDLSSIRSLLITALRFAARSSNTYDIHSALEDTVRVWEYGLQKYNAWNWAQGMNWSHPLASMYRHLSKYLLGELNDPETGLPHTAHIICNALMLTHFIRYYPEGNDLPSKEYFQIPQEKSDVSSTE